MKLKKILAACTAVLLGGGLTLATVASAEAHHPVISATFACLTPTTGTITWSVSNSENHDANVTSSTNGLYNGVTLPGSKAAVQKTQSVTGTGTFTLQVAATWPQNGYSDTKSGNIVITAAHYAGCPPVDVKDAEADVQVTPGTCAAAGSLTFTQKHATWTTAVNPASGTRTAAADSGHSFAPNGDKTKTVTWTPGDLAQKTGVVCETHIVTAPTVTVIDQCGEFGSVTTPASNNEVTYTVTGAGGVGIYTVTAQAVAPFTFPDDAPAGWTVVVAKQQWVWTVNLGQYEPCVAKADVKVTPGTCLAAGSVTITATNATYVDSPLGTVTFTANPNSVFDGGATTKVITYKPADLAQKADNDKECMPTLDLVTPIVSSTPITCTSSGSFTIGGEHVAWTVDGVPTTAGKYTVTSGRTVVLVASPVAPHGFDTDQQTTWELKFAAPRTLCDPPTLALTGAEDGPTFLAGAAAMLLLGSGLLYARRRAA